MASAPTVIAHRGAREAAQENTLPAFRLAREFGAEWVELDARRTADGVVVDQRLAQHAPHRRQLLRRCCRGGQQRAALRVGGALEQPVPASSGARGMWPSLVNKERGMWPSLVRRAACRPSAP